MSFELTQKVIRNRLNLSPCEKLLLAILADKIDHKGFCYPSYKGLERLSGYSRRQVIRGIKVLIKEKLVTVTKITGIQNQYILSEELLDLRIKKANKEWLGSANMSLALVSGSHPPSAKVSPHPCQGVTLVTKVVNKGVDKSSKVNETFTEEQSTPVNQVGEKEMKIEDLDLAKFGKTKKQKMNPIDIWRNACVDFQNENLMAIVDLKFTQIQAGIMNKAAKKLEGAFIEVVEYCVPNWGKFVKFVNLHKGETKKPVSPEINYFVFNANQALMFFKSKSDTKVKKNKLKVDKPIKSKKVMDAHTKALLKAAGKDRGN